MSNRTWSTQKISENKIEAMKVLRANGCSYAQIAQVCGVGKTTAEKYVKHIVQLPKHMQKNPFSKLLYKRSKQPIEVKLAALPSLDETLTQRELRDKQYWLENHVEGNRFEGPLDQFSLQELWEMMKVPTDYVSKLGSTAWYDYYLAEQLLKPTPFGKSLSNTQICIQDFLDRHRKAMAQVFRSGGKTVLVLGGLTRLISEHKENNYFVQSEIVSKSRRRVQAVRNILMTNKPLIGDYGYLPRDIKYKGIRDTWKLGEFTVKRETVQTDPTLMALSWTDAEMLGGHFAGGFFDDPWSTKLEQQGEKKKEQWFEWYDTTFQGCMEDSSFEWFICTPKGIEDIYKTLERTGQYHVYKQPAILKYPSKYHYEDAIDASGKKYKKAIVETQDWHISDDCHGRFSIESFLQKKASMVRGMASFEQEYQLNPVPKGGRAFKWADLRWFNSIAEFYNLIEDEKKRAKLVKIQGGMDLSFGKSQRSAFTALCVVGYLHPNAYLLQTFLGRGLGINGKAKLIKRAVKMFPKLNIIHMEADVSQSENVDDIKKLCPEVKIKEVLSRQEQAKITKSDYPTTWSKKQIRIHSQLENIFEANRFFVNKNMNHFDEFEMEYKFFPGSPFIDLLDALGMVISRLTRVRALLYGLSG